MKTVIETLNAAIWGIPVLLLILMVGVLLTIRSKFAQFRLLPTALKAFFRSVKSNQSGYRALCTALAATVGTGNIAGVAGAIALGGPGVLFWMWICAFLGMITKFAEVTLALHYRTKDKNGEYIGGPMYVIQEALPKNMRFLGYAYSYFGIVAALGVGNAAQVNAVIGGVKSIAESLACPLNSRAVLITGIILAACVGIILHSGTSGIGRIAEKLIPFASAVYIFLAVIVLIIKIDRIPYALYRIIRGAFSPKAITGGMVGSVFLTIRIGTSRGVFTNEAGMGTASIAHAASNVDHPVEQGILGIIEVFLDTVVICTLTGFVILCSDIPIEFGIDPGISLTLDAFSTILGNWCRILLTALTCIFAFATLLGWGLYGGRCAQYLFGGNAWKHFTFMQAAAVLAGTVLHTSTIWLISEIVNGLMAIPNLIALVMLTGVFTAILEDYQQKREAYSLK